MKAAAIPRFAWLRRQAGVSGRELRLPDAARAVGRAWPAIRAARKAGSVLGGLDEITVVLVSDRRMAALHGEFLGDASPTDVITFQHGEIVISAETARREALARGEPIPREVARYAVHGLLHLAGWSDAAPRSAAAMRAVQERILASACRGLAGMRKGG